MMKFIRDSARIVPAILMSLGLAVTAFGQFSSYHIGNSLTFDGSGAGNVGGNPFHIEWMASYYGHSDYRYSLHVDNTQPLYTIFANPQGVNGVDFVRQPYGAWENALANYQWDAMVLEPYYNLNTTLGIDKQSITDFIQYAKQNSANQNTITYLYQVWPQQSWFTDFSQYWLTGSSNNDSTLNRPRREYYQNLMNWAHETLLPQGHLVREIPTMEVWYEIDQAIKSGAITEMTMADMYRDGIHGSNAHGRYVASAVSFATLFRQEISGYVPDPTRYPLSVTQPQLYQKINAIIDRVVASSYYTGMGDFNDDGWVNTADLAVWQAGFGTEYDGRDFMHWQRNYRDYGPPPLAAVTVPEPGSVFLLLAGLASVALMRR